MRLSLLFALAFFYTEICRSEVNTEPAPSIYSAWIDSAHRYISQQIASFSYQMDTFFSDKRLDEEGTGTRINLSLSSYSQYQQGTQVTPTINLRLRLPRTQDKLRLIVQSSQDEEKTAEDPQANDEAIDIEDATFFEPDIFTTALEYVFSSTADWNISARSGLVFSETEPNPFGRIRATRLINLNSWNARITEQVAWYAIEGIVEETSLSLEHKVDPTTLIRLDASAIWTESTQSFALGQSNSILHQVNPRTATIYSVGITGNSELPYDITSFYATTRLRYRLFGQWMYIEAAPTMTMPRERNFSAVPSIFFILQTVWG